MTVPVRRACRKHACGVKTITTCEAMTVMHDRPRDCACMATPCGHAETCALIEADGNGIRCTNSARPIPVFGNYRTYLAIDRPLVRFWGKAKLFRDTHVGWGDNPNIAMRAGWRVLGFAPQPTRSRTPTRDAHGTLGFAPDQVRGSAQPTGSLRCTHASGFNRRLCTHCRPTARTPCVSTDSSSR